MSLEQIEEFVFKQKNLIPLTKDEVMEVVKDMSKKYKKQLIEVTILWSFVNRVFHLDKEEIEEQYNVRLYLK